MFSKVLEKVIHQRIYNFLEKKNILNDLQCGFWRKLGTIDAMTYLTSQLMPSLDKKEFNLNVFINVRKAFDKIDHTILLYKLQKLGIRVYPTPGLQITCLIEHHQYS